jgi:hypothetical protein
VTLQDELQGLTFPQLVERLQLRLDLPELRLLEVAGSRVMVRVDGRAVPLEVPDNRAPEPLPQPGPTLRVNNIQQIQITAQPVTAAATSGATNNQPPPSVGTQSQEMASAVPGVRPVGHSGSGRPDGTASQAARPGAATARSVAPAAAPAGRPAGPAANGPAAAPAPARPEKPAPPEKPDNGGRFNLLEID